MGSVSRRLRDVLILLPLGVVVVLHIIMLLAGLPQEHMRVHAWTSIVAAGISGLVYLITKPK